jgi:hypothetical protein
MNWPIPGPAMARPRPGFGKADLAKADLAKADLAKADLAKADLAKADLAKADLAKADLAKADLGGLRQDWGPGAPSALGDGCRTPGGSSNQWPITPDD